MVINIFDSIPVPAGNGVGASVSMVGRGLKTFVIGGAFDATVVIEIGIGGLWAPAFVVDKESQFRDVPIIAEDVRVRVVNYRSGLATVEVGGSPSVDIFAALIVPPGDGAGVPLDTSLFGQNKTLIVSGDFDAVVTLEGAESVAGPWAPLVRIDKPNNFYNTFIITQFVRVVVSSYRSGVITAGLGAADFGDGSGVELSDHNIWAAAQIVAPVSVPVIGGVITANAEQSNVFNATLIDVTTQLATPTNLTNGQTIIWRIIQDGFGGRALTFDAGFDWGSDSAPDLTVEAGGALTIITGITDGVKMFVTAKLGFVA